MLDSGSAVIMALVRYTDWWHPSSTSIIQVGVARRSKDLSDGFRAGLLDTLDERTELCRRMSLIPVRDRHILFLWYVEQLSAQEIAKELRISRRQCFRRRAKAIDRLVELGQPDQAA